MMYKSMDPGSSRPAWRSALRALGLSLLLVGTCLSQKASAITSAEDGQEVDETLDWNAHLIDGTSRPGPPLRQRFGLPPL